MAEPGEITLLLKRVRSGDREAQAELLPLVYEHLHGIAERQFQSERNGHTLQPTALISELYLRIIRDGDIDWQSRAHFYAVAASTIRRILVDYARVANAQRRPRPSGRVQFEDVVIYSNDRAEEILVVDEALRKLSEWDDRQAKVVELRFFGGLSFEETAEALGVSNRTVMRDWTMARAWLAASLRERERESKRQ
jgi:RNA polymerase sigma factor (TIGR02999 family)